MDKATYLTLPEIRSRIRRWCAYQDRSQYETRSKLMELGLEPHLVDEEIVQLLNEKYLSDARFAEAYIRGHLSKGWGRVKILRSLRAHKLPPLLVESTLHAVLDETAYLSALDKALAAKRQSLTERNPVRRNYKLARHLEQKGYTFDEIKAALKRAGLSPR